MGFGGISPWSLILILVIILLLFGTKRLRNMGSDLGSAFKSFKNAVKEENEAPKPTQQVTHDETGRVINAEVTHKDKV